MTTPNLESTNPLSGSSPVQRSEKLKNCDIVMKGGITSGVVYPQAVFELSRKYKFKSIGGTSAGAIAAAATAAAERGYSKDRDTFIELNDLPNWLGKSKHEKKKSKLFGLFQPAAQTQPKSNLFALFQPAAQTQPLFDTLTAFLGNNKGKWHRVLNAALWNFKWAALLGSLPGLILLIVLILRANHWLLVLWGGICALLLLVIGVLLAVIFHALWIAIKGIPTNWYGLCTGYAPSKPHQPEALTVWLSNLLNRLAGVPALACPLTFGDLWGKPLFTMSLGYIQELDQHQISSSLRQKFEAASKQLPDNPTVLVEQAGAKWTVRDVRGHSYRIQRDNKILNVYDAEEQIELAMITTNLSQGRPYKLPFDTNYYYFDPEEFKQFFPGEIVKWMVEHPRQQHTNANPERNGRKLAPLPDAANLPVVVATRMSLSFPILLSAVPLYAVDWTRQKHVKQEDPIHTDEAHTPTHTTHSRFETCWFSDGGIVINFPIHFFDRPLPAWPTFGIDLSAFPPDRKRSKNEADNFQMLTANNQDRRVSWNYFEHHPTYGKIAAFLGAILGTARSWSDEMQVHAPGYRERIVHIYIDKDEGGLNLNMPHTFVQNLSTRGMYAGRAIAEGFTNSDPLQPMLWDNHRWIRYRSTMAMLEETLQQVQDGLEFPQSDELPYAELIKRDKHTQPNSYRWKRNLQQEFAQATTDDLVKLINTWCDKHQTFAEGAPKPQPELRIQPRI